MSSTPLDIGRPAYTPSLSERFRTLWRRRETIRFLTSSQLKAGHRDKVLGRLWSLLDPLMFMLVYYFVFGVLFGLAGGGRSVEFMLYILIGVLTYQFVSATISQATNCVRSNRGLIHEISFPKAVFPVAAAFARLYDFMWGLFVLLVLLLLGGIWPTVYYAWLPLLIVLTLVFALGVGLIVAYLGAFFADMANVVSVALRLLFYCSPVFYFIRDQGKYKAMFHNPIGVRVYMLNPFSCLMECYRDAMLWGRTPDPWYLSYAAVFSVVILFVGFAVFCRGEGKFAKYI